MSGMGKLSDEQRRLVEDHYELVSVVAGAVFRTAPHALERAELESLAGMGLVMAAERWPEYCERRGYDPNRLEYFVEYARRRMRGAIYDALRARDWATRTMRARAKQISKAQDEPGLTTTDLVQRTGLTEQEIQQTLDGMSKSPVSLEDSSDVTDSSSVEGSVFEREVCEVLVGQVRELPWEQQVVVALHYYGGAELRDVAAVMGLTEARVSNLHTDAVLSVYEGVKSAVV